MNKITIRDTSVSPPEKRWEYLVKETNYKVTVAAYCNLKNAVSRHCIANGVTVPTEDEITKYLCDNLTIDCRTGRDPYQNMFTKQDDFVHPDYRPVHRDQWPIWARVISVASLTADRGVGDTVRRNIGDFASETFKNWHKKIFGRPCSCNERQDKWNAQFPYQKD